MNARTIEWNDDWKKLAVRGKSKLVERWSDTYKSRMEKWLLKFRVEDVDSFETKMENKVVYKPMYLELILREFGH